MASRVSGKVAFVTGGASGIGAALTTKLVDEAAEVWIADRQIGPAQELAERLNSGAGKAHAIELDVRNYSSFERAVAEAVQQSGRIDYLFNNAGIGVGGEVDSYTLDDWNDVFDVNLRGVVHGIQAVYPVMIRQHSGHIVNTASMAGLVATPGRRATPPPSTPSSRLSKALRVEAERHGVQVSVFCPGAIRTPSEYPADQPVGVVDVCGNLAPEWFNYRLDGVQTGFFNPEAARATRSSRVKTPACR